jgi:type I restriction enzyme, S subunit
MEPPSDPGQFTDRSTQVFIGDLYFELSLKIEVDMASRRAARALAMNLFREAQSKGTYTASLGELTSSISRGVAPKYAEIGDGVRVLNQKCVRDGWVTLEAARWMHPIEVAPIRVAQREDILVNSTGVGTLGRVGRWLGNQRVNVDGHVTIVRPDSEKLGPAILGYAMLASEAGIEALGEGSTGQTELGRERIAGLAIEVPTRTDLGKLTRELNVLDEVGEGLSHEMHALSALRDALLPKLISGELRIQDGV